ncbi:MAG: hypothetical protein JOY54_21485 [Acidobacteriaceae bacterium]|nr:hypothetical protein [Acidobacteriaceae bacterium]
MRFLTRLLPVGGLAIASASLLLAQHGGGHGGAGMSHGAPQAAPGHAAPAGHAFTGNSVGSPIIAPFGHQAVNPYSYSYGYYGHGHGYYGHGNFYHHDFRRYPFAYFFAPYYYPSLGYDSSPYYGDYYPYEVGDVAQDPASQQQDLAQNLAPSYGAPPPPYANYPPPYANYPPPAGYSPSPEAPSPQPPPPPSSEPPQPPAPPITLILKDGQQFTVQNYAVMGQTFWDFSKPPARKIPLSNINIPASAKATEASGAEFPPISQGKT